MAQGSGRSFCITVSAVQEWKLFFKDGVSICVFKMQFVSIYFYPLIEQNLIQNPLHTNTHIHTQPSKIIKKNFKAGFHLHMDFTPRKDDL